MSSVCQNALSLAYLSAIKIQPQAKEEATTFCPIDQPCVRQATNPRAGGASIDQSPGLNL